MGLAMYSGAAFPKAIAAERHWALLDIVRYHSPSEFSTPWLHGPWQWPNGGPLFWSKTPSTSTPESPFCNDLQPSCPHRCKENANGDCTNASKLLLGDLVMLAQKETCICQCCNKYSAKLVSRDMCSFPVHMNERHPKGSRDQQWSEAIFSMRQGRTKGVRCWIGISSKHPKEENKSTPELQHSEPSKIGLEDCPLGHCHCLEFHFFTCMAIHIHP